MSTLYGMSHVADRVGLRASRVPSVPDRLADPHGPGIGVPVEDLLNPAVLPRVWRDLHGPSRVRRPWQTRHPALCATGPAQRVVRVPRAS